MSFSPLVMLWRLQSEPDTINRPGLKVQDNDLEMLMCVCVPTLCDAIVGQDLLFNVDVKKGNIRCVRVCVCTND